MELKDYIAKARETALPTAYSFEYLVPGLISEVGEIYGVLAKAHRDYLPDEVVNDRLVKELGDVAWVTALLLYHVGERYRGRGGHLPLPEEGTPVNEGLTPEEVVGALLTDGVSIKGALPNDGAPDSSAREGLFYAHRLARIIWGLLERYSEDLCGSSFDVVLETNLAKLASRKSRGVLGGDGDER